MRRLLALASLALVAACSQPKDTEPSYKAPPEPAAPVTPLIDASALTGEGWKTFKVGLTPEQIGVASFAQPLPTGTDCATVRPISPAQGVAIMLEDGKVSRITLEAGSTVRTDKAISIGDAEAKVRAAYPVGLEEGPHKYEPAPAKYLTIWNAEKTRGLRYVIGSNGLVAEVNGGGPSIANVEGCS